jgi:hypothetical protein
MQTVVRKPCHEDKALEATGSTPLRRGRLHHLVKPHVTSFDGFHGTQARPRDEGPSSCRAVYMSALASFVLVNNLKLRTGKVGAEFTTPANL